MEAQISWRAFLTYEQEVRSRSIKWVNELGLTICEATKRAMADNELRTKYLVSALAIQRAATPGGGTKRTFDQFHEEAENIHWGGKGKGDKGGWKGHDKDKGKKGGGKKGKGGKEKRKANNAAARGPNYRFNACKKAGKVKMGPNGSCWNYNRTEGCKLGKACTFEHTCSFCGRSHSVVVCDSFEKWFNAAEKSGQ